MNVFYSKEELIPSLEMERSKGTKIGFIPTMGALHGGHLALIRASKKEADLTVCSIFVNPSQFNSREDLLKYPKNFREDFRKLKKEGCDIVYAPSEDDLYDPSGRMITSIHFGDLENTLEGKYRPGHFQGVAIVVIKLFNIIRPKYTYFGQKDLQQFFLIETIIRDLSFDIQLRCIPTVREKDGLAISSRNTRIPNDIRPIANSFYHSLTTGRDMLHTGKSLKEVKAYVNDMFINKPQLELEYFELVDTRNFRITDNIKDKYKTALCIAGYLNNIRLIDNVMYI
jgi:pantoate--beta-alanine ligase